MLSLAGCSRQLEKPIRTCPGKESVLLSLHRLHSYGLNSKPLKANGQCLAKFYAEGKVQKENFPVKLWFSPPSRIRMHGDVAFNARGIVLGCNEHEFWLAMKPKELGNSYFWGRWSDGPALGKLKISPKILLEGFGIVGVRDKRDWFLSNEDGFDILTKRSAWGAVIKRVYISVCEYRVRRIEYFGPNEKRVAIAELDDYKDICNGFFVPTIIRVINSNMDGTTDSFRIILESVRLYEFTEKQQEVFFVRSEPKGFESVFRLENNRLVKQPGK